jgi:hypothetical protein
VAEVLARLFELLPSPPLTTSQVGRLKRRHSQDRSL